MAFQRIRDNFIHFFQKKNAPIALIIVFLVAYFTFRPILASVFISVSATIYMAKTLFSLFPKKLRFEKFLSLKHILYLSILFYLILSAFNLRVESIDGLNFSYRIAYFIKENSKLEFLDAAPKPFLFEFLMGIIWRFTNLNILSLIMGMLGLTSVYSTYLLIKTYKPAESTKSNLIYLLLTCCNPLFISLLLFQFKPDLLAFTLSNLAFICYIKFVKTKSFSFLYLLAINLGLILTIKILYVIMVGPLVAVALVYLVKITKIRDAIKHSVIFTIIVAAPIIIWMTIFGATIPKFENYLSFNGLVKTGTLQLEYNKTIYGQCNRERIISDYSSILETPRNVMGKIFQPLYYLHLEINSPEQLLTLADPGPFIYIGIIIFIIVTIKKNTNKKDYLDNSLSLTILMATIIFYINVTHVFWYILFAFPFFAISFRDYVIRPSNMVSGKYILNKIMNIYFIAYIGISVLFIILESHNFVIDTGDFRRTFKGNEVNTSIVVEKYAQEGFIFDAIAYPYGVRYPLVRDSYKRIYTNQYFFASTDLSSDEIKDYLKSKNIRYIMSFKEKLLNGYIYSECISENNKKLFQFIEQNTELVQDRNVDYNFLYRIKD